MSKKELVKSIIDDLVNEGTDFHEITQSTLTERRELSEISKTTIKRAKNEYKKEKIVVKENYKESLIKRKIYNFLDKNPKTPLSELREAMPEIPPAKISEYHLFWKRKREKARADKKRRALLVNPRKLKEMVFNYLNTNENVTNEDLFKAFPDANRSSISSYYGHWKKKKISHEKGKEGSLYNVVFRFLDNNGESTIDDLKKSFPDVPLRSLEVYYKLWIKKQDEEKKKSQKESTVEKEPAAQKTSQPEQKDSKVVVFDKDRKTKRKQPTGTGKETGRLTPKDKAVITDLKKTIEDQKVTLTALEVEYSFLRDNQAMIFKDIDPVNEDELEEIHEFLKTYLKGLKKKKSAV